jgi:glutaredoxin 2
MTHFETCCALRTIYESKNADYADSFGESIKEWGILAAVVRIDDKMRRLKSLVKQPAKVQSETMRDTLMDMANYCIMSVMELDKEVGEIEAIR